MGLENFLAFFFGLKKYVPEKLRLSTEKGLIVLFYFFTASCITTNGSHYTAFLDC